MSRSVKKTPIIKDSGKGKKEEKRRANKKVRRLQIDEENGIEISDGKSYKKVFNSWSICDEVWKWTKQDAITYYLAHCIPETYSDKFSTKEQCENRVKEFKKAYPTLDDFLNWWEKIYKRK